jgi:hypothetical protein
MYAMQAAGCSFKVAGRVASAFASSSATAQLGSEAAQNSFLKLEHLRHMIPAFAVAMFSEISEHDCRVDVSSSQLRAAAAAVNEPE